MRTGFTLIFLFLVLTMLSQSEQLSVYNTITEARRIATEEKDYTKAINLIHKRIEDETEVPTKDAEILAARFYFWNKQNLTAEVQTRKLLELYPDEYELHNLLIDIYESQKMYAKSTEAIKQALMLFPEDKKLMFRLAYNMNGNKEYRYAKVLTEKLLDEDPKNQKLKTLLNTIHVSSVKNFIFAEYRHHFLNEEQDKLNFQTIQYGRNFRESTFIGGFSSAKASSTSGLQFFGEMYNKLNSKLYSYVHFAYSKSAMFPSFRLNSGLYRSLKYNMELSVYLSLIQQLEYTRLVSLGLSKSINKSSFSATFNFINEAQHNDTSYRMRFRQYIGNQSNFVGLAYGSFSKGETIRGTELDLNAKYISYEAQAAIGLKAYLGLNYSRNISETKEAKDQITMYLKHSF